MKRVIVAISGASGSVYAIDLLKELKKIPNVKVHGVISDWAYENIRLETDLNKQQVQDLMDVHYHNRDLSAAISSGSFLVDAMIIVPASMKTVAGIACGFHDGLIGRAADVTLKEQRPLILVPRETPLSPIHLENLTKLANLGVKIMPPMPAFYNHPQTIQDLITHQTMKLLDALKIEHHLGKRWQGEDHETI